MVPFLLLLGAIALYLVGYLNGRAERDHKACELLAEERHQRIVAEEVLKATCEHANAAMFRADLHVQSLRRAEDAYREMLARQRREILPVREVANG